MVGVSPDKVHTWYGRRTWWAGVEAAPSSRVAPRDLKPPGSYAARPPTSLTLLGQPLRSRPYGTRGLRGILRSVGGDIKVDGVKRQAPISEER